MRKEAQLGWPIEPPEFLAGKSRKRPEKDLLETIKEIERYKAEHFTPRPVRRPGTESSFRYGYAALPALGLGGIGGSIYYGLRKRRKKTLARAAETLEKLKPTKPKSMLPYLGLGVLGAYTAMRILERNKSNKEE